MKILQITASYKPAYIYGGPIMSVSMLAEQLVLGNIAVDVITTNANGYQNLPVKVNTPVLLDGVNTIYFNRITKDHTQFSPALLIHLWRKARQYDIIHIQAWWNLVAIFSCIIALHKGVAVIVSPRGTLSNYSFTNKNKVLKKIIHRFFTKPLLKKCFIHVTSENEYKSLQKIILPKGYFNIPNFIKLGIYRFPPKFPLSNHLKLIFLSRIEEKKGLDILLNALPKLTIPYRLSIVGDGDADYVSSLKNITKKNHTDKFIEWLGFQVVNKFDLLQDHDLLVLPSYDENFGNVIIESLSVGTAVLVGENVGLAEYINNNQFGWLCATNAISVSTEINSIYGRRQELKQIKKNAPSKILKDFDPSNLVKKYIDMYNQIIIL